MKSNEGKHYTSKCLSAQSLHLDIAREGRIDTKDVNPAKKQTKTKKTTNNADIVSSEIWPGATAACSVHCWRAVVVSVSGSPQHLSAGHLRGWLTHDFTQRVFSQMKEIM